MFLIDNYSPFLESVLVCPISKETLTRKGDTLYSKCGFSYPDGDLRVGLDFSAEWSSGQISFTQFQERWLATTEQDPGYHAAVDRDVSDVYEKIKLTGTVLDVAGGFSMAAVQGFANPDTYISLDAFPFIWSRLAPYKRFCEHYAACSGLTRVTAYAEFLPIRTGSVDTVHMRSCLDHLANPLLALKEAFRALKPGGKVVVGISLEGAYKKEARGTYEKFKQFVKRIGLTRVIYEKVFDHHLFHPTLESVRGLLRSAGFEIQQEVWQAAYFNVLYVEARRA